ncbi:MAG TPA: tetratricopeptide repeat protein [Pyrinomonadaceae bacterium]|nr:tetratricopeptide repeat protein [Pyrinomonadaceae bacterium]
MFRKVVFLFVVTLPLFQPGCSSASHDANVPANSKIDEATVSDAQAALNEGSSLLDAGETERAIEALNRAVDLDPDLAEAYFKLGIAYGLIEKRDETAETVANAVESTPTPDRSKKEKKSNSEIAFEKAVAAYKKIIAKNDEDHSAYFNLGRSYNKLNEDEEAEKALRQAAKLNPEDTEYQTELGAIRIKLADYREAILPLKKALELDPGNIRAQELLEDAEAGRRRIDFSTVKKDDKSANKNANVSNANSPPLPPINTKPQSPDTKGDKPRPAPTKQ